MKRLFLILFLLLASFSCSLQAQDFALKTNGLYWLTTTPNVGMEFALSRKVTMDLSAAYNPWTFKDDKKMRFWLAQPEVKYWFCEKFEGHFIGVHLMELNILADSATNVTMVIWPEEVSLTVMIGFFHRIGILKRPLA